MLSSRLPLDVLYVVSCHLAGIHAFGTLAALHWANHIVAETTLPVLYETVLLDNPDRRAIGGRTITGNPNRFQYTKFLICLLRAGERPPPWMSPASLVAILFVAQKTKPVIDQKLEVWIRQPITAATLFGTIALTPVHRSVAQAEPAKPTKESGNGRATPTDPCQTSGSKSRVIRQLSSLVVAGEDACLLSGPLPTSGWTTMVRLGGTTVLGDLAKGWPYRMLDCVFELMKLRGHPRNPELYDRISSQQYHLRLELDLEAYNAFAERFVREALLDPAICLNRIAVILHGTTSFAQLQRLVDDMLPVCTRHVTSYDDILPSINHSNEVLTLGLGDFPWQDFQVPMPKMSVQLVRIDDGIRFINSETARQRASAANMLRFMRAPSLQGYVGSMAQMMRNAENSDR